MATPDSLHWEKEHLGEHGVYPGHPIIGACMVMDRYPNLGTARERRPNSDSGNALSDSFIPGAGCAVHAALDTLHFAQTQGLEPAYAHAARYWDGWERQNEKNKASAEQGRRQAERIKPYFEARLKVWGGPDDAGSPYRV